LTDDDWRQAFEVVTLNFVRFVRQVVPYMRASGGAGSSDPVQLREGAG
jgi:3-oxoacyl-[acyl-carrier protein] reductase